jgi:hypothetical protein
METQLWYSHRLVQKAAIFSLFLCMLLLGGCAGLQSQKVKASVSALTSPGAEAFRRYVLLPGDKNVSPSDLQFGEYARCIDRAMASEGFTRVERIEDANLAVVALYSIGEPESRAYTYTVPHWGQTGISSSTTYGTVSTYGNYGTYTGSTYYQPSYGVTGYSTGVGTITTYARMLGLFAYDSASANASSEPKPLWSVTVASIGQSGDLRGIFPFLVAAAKPYLAKATPGQAVSVELATDDKRVADLREPATPTAPSPHP